MSGGGRRPTPRSVRCASDSVYHFPTTISNFVIMIDKFRIRLAGREAEGSESCACGR
jgi:hypothetical protein